MTNQDMLTDLKNYIDIKNDALATRLKKEIVEEISQKIDNLAEKVNKLDLKLERRTVEILEAIGDTLVPRIESCESRLDKFETTAAK